MRAAVRTALIRELEMRGYSTQAEGWASPHDGMIIVDDHLAGIGIADFLELMVASQVARSQVGYAPRTLNEAEYTV